MHQHESAALQVVTCDSEESGTKAYFYVKSKVCYESDACRNQMVVWALERELAPTNFSPHRCKCSPLLDSSSCAMAQGGWEFGSQVPQEQHSAG